jgi:cyclohexanone monooxygenase
VFEGMDGFRGPIYHTGDWPHEPVDLSGQRVGIIGNGASAIQAIPIIARQVEQLFVFQRTPNYSIPAHNEPLDPQVQTKVKANYAEFRRNNSQGFGAAGFRHRTDLGTDATPEQRQAEFEYRWRLGGLFILGSYPDLLINKEVNDAAAEFIRSKIRSIVKDPEVAAKLCPDQVVGCKRITVDTDYYATYNRSNVTLVDVSTDPIERFTAEGLSTGGRHYQLDTVILATGFDAMTGSLFKIDIRGRAGAALKEKWAAGPRTYLGLMTAGFPNLFTVSGPGSPSVLSNMVVTIEQHVNWIRECLDYAQQHGIDAIEPSLEAEDAWVDHVNEMANATLFVGCNSWYLGVNVPGKPRIFMPYSGGFPAYAQKCAEVAANRYEGFVLTR